MHSQIVFESWVSYMPPRPPPRSERTTLSTEVVSSFTKGYLLSWEAFVGKWSVQSQKRSPRVWFNALLSHC